MTGPRIAAMGDSITLGVGDGVHHQWGQVGWARHVATATGASAVVNLAANGVRARDLEAQAREALTFRPDIVLATVGGNDALRGDFDAAEVERCTTFALRLLTGAGATVVLLSIDRIGLFDLMPGPVATAMASRAAQVNAALLTAAGLAGARVVDGAAVFAAAGRTSWHIDRIHPSPSGHRMLAAAALMAVEAQWPAVAPIPSPPPPPARPARVWWLVRHGTPWAARRSRDLLPQFVSVVRAEMRAGHRSVERDKATAG